MVSFVYLRGKFVARIAAQSWTDLDLIDRLLLSNPHNVQEVVWDQAQERQEGPQPSLEPWTHCWVHSINSVHLLFVCLWRGGSSKRATRHAKGTSIEFGFYLQSVLRRKSTKAHSRRGAHMTAAAVCGGSPLEPHHQDQTLRSDSNSGRALLPMGQGLNRRRSQPIACHMDQGDVRDGGGGIALNRGKSFHSQLAPPICSS